MVKTEIINHGKIINYVDDFEQVQVISENNQLTNFKSYTNRFAKQLENQISENLSLIKKEKFKLLVVGDEFYNTMKIKKIVILVDDNISKQCVINSITEKLVSSNIDVIVDIYKEEPTSYVSEFKNRSQFVCNQIHRYLTNQLNFNGITKLNTAIYNNELQSFELSVSGKGTNDKIFNTIKSIRFDYNQIMTITEDDIFTILNDILS